MFDIKKIKVSVVNEEKKDINKNESNLIIGCGINMNKLIPDNDHPGKYKLEKINTAYKSVYTA